jgi:hypothetical protein
VPLLSVLCRSERADAKRKRRQQTVPEKAVWGMRLIARRFPRQPLMIAGDGAFASLEVFRTLKDRVVCGARWRIGARVFNPPPPRKKERMKLGNRARRDPIEGREASLSREPLT